MKKPLLNLLLLCLISSALSGQIRYNDWGLSHYNRILEVITPLDSLRGIYGNGLQLTSYAEFADSFVLSYDNINRVSTIVLLSQDIEGNYYSDGTYHFGYNQSLISSISFRAEARDYMYDYFYELYYDSLNRLAQVLASRQKGKGEIDTLNRYVYHYLEGFDYKETCSEWISHSWRDIGVRQYQYDSLGRVKKETWVAFQSGSKAIDMLHYPTTYFYDESGRLERKCYTFFWDEKDKSRCNSYTYINGWLASIQSETQMGEGFMYRYEYQYDPRGRLTLLTSYQEIDSLWDPYERRTFIYYPNGLIGEEKWEGKMPSPYMEYEIILHKRYYYNKSH